MSLGTFVLSDKDKNEIAAAIALAEEHTFGEIRVFLERYCKADPVERATEVFFDMGMNETALQSGVLIYIAYADQQFAILGDRAINEKVPANFWSDVKDQMALEFSKGNFLIGITNAVFLCGNHLKKHFPTDGSNPNELSNEVFSDDE